MKLFLTLILVFFTIGTVQADLSQDLYNLAQEKGQLSIEALKLLKKYNIDPEKDAEYQAANANAFELAQKLVKTRKANSALKPYYKASSEAQKNLMTLMMVKDKDQEAIKKAKKGYIVSRQMLEKEAAKIPELQTLAAEARSANEVANKVEFNLISKTPEGKEYIQKIKTLDEKIEALRKQL